MKDVFERRKPSIRFTLMLSFSIIIATCSVVFTLLLIQYRTQDYIDLIDSRLRTAAEFSKELLNPDFHDLIVDETSISKEQFHRIVTRNDDLCRRLDIQYLWSVLLLDNRTVFTSATHSNLNDTNSSYASFFDTHNDPGAFSSVIGPKSTISYSTFNNEWGTGRMVLIPGRDARGRTYVFGASVQLEKINAIIRNSILESGGIGLAILFITLIFTLLLSRSFMKPIIGLVDAAQCMAAGNFDVPLMPLKTRELFALSNSLDQMRLDLQHSLAVLRESEERFKKLFVEAPLGVALIDSLTGHIYEVNPMFAKIAGRAMEEMVQIDWMSITHPDDVQEDLDNMALLNAGKINGFQMDKRYLHQDGTAVWINMTIAPMKVEDKEHPRHLCMIADITERKRAENNLQESETRYQRITEAITDYIYTALVVDGRVEKTTHGPGCLAVTGYRAEEFVSDPFLWIRMVAAEDRPEVEKQSRRILAGEIPPPSEHRIVRKNGTMRWVKNTFVPRYDKEGVLVAYDGLLQDVNDRKRAEEILRENEQRLSSIYDSTGDILFYLRVEPEGQYRFNSVNTAFCSVTGLRQEQVVGKLVHEVIPEPSLTMVLDKYRQAIEEKKIVRWEETSDYPARRVIGAVSVTPVFDVKGICTFLVGSVHDITDLKRIEETLRTSEEKWRSLVTTIPDFIAMLDQSGNFLFLNHYAEGFTENDVIGTSVYEYLSPESRELFKKKLEECLTTHTQQKFEYTGMGDNASMRMYQQYLIPLFGENNTPVSLGVSRDITELKHAENELRSSLLEKEMLVREVHHRVKNNLAAIIALLKMQEKASDDSTVTNVLTDLGMRVKSMALVHEQLYRSENISRIDCQEYLGALISSIRTSLKAPNDLRISIHASGVTMGLDTAIPIGMIVNELAMNAMKYAFPNGTPRHGQKECELIVSIEQNNETCTLIIADNGVGMRENIDWEATATLGLRLVRALGEHQLGGTISYDGSLGTRFILTFQPKDERTPPK